MKLPEAFLALQRTTPFCFMGHSDFFFLEILFCCNENTDSSFFSFQTFFWWFLWSLFLFLFHETLGLSFLFVFLWGGVLVLYVGLICNRQVLYHWTVSSALNVAIHQDFILDSPCPNAAEAHACNAASRRSNVERDLVHGVHSALSNDALCYIQIMYFAMYVSFHLLCIWGNPCKDW